MELNKSLKRLDLQGIRALAIFAVLGFHFFPKYVPNGYLGVDQFFVLSGFLMCMLLKRAQNEPVCSLVSHFYSKRSKRILPLYLMFLAISIIALYTVFPTSAIKSNRESAVSALLFVSNRPKTESEDYFELLSVAIDIFTHTWSLSVEVQFYLLVPLIFFIGNRLSTKSQQTFYASLASTSYLFSFLSSPNVAFNSVFARIWQFLVGFIVYLASSSTEGYHTLEDVEEPLKRNAKFVSFMIIFLITMTMCPLGLPADFLRPLVTISTGLLMLVSERSSVLSNPGLTYLGDISYSLYLIHWPIYAYWKVTANGYQFALCLALVGSIFLAVICYESFEKWYLQLSTSSVCVLVFLLFLLNVLLINKDHFQNHLTQNATSLDKITDNMTMNDAARMNEKWNRDDLANLHSATCDYKKASSHQNWCRHRGLSPNGPYKLAIIGNSWTANHATLFYQECGYKARSILQVYAPACEPLHPTEEFEWCRNEMVVFENRILEEQPDYAFIITRYISIGYRIPENVTNLEDDPTYRTMKKETRKLLASVKYKLFILDAIPRVFSNQVSEIVPMLKGNNSLEYINKHLIDVANFNLARKRHALLAKEFKGRVVLVDYKPEFYNYTSKTFRFFDERGFSYFNGGNHMTPYGLEHVRHVWKDICSKL